MEATNMRLQRSESRHTGGAADTATFPCCYCLDSCLDRRMGQQHHGPGNLPHHGALVKETNREAESHTGNLQDGDLSLSSACAAPLLTYFHVS